MKSAAKTKLQRLMKSFKISICAAIASMHCSCICGSTSPKKWSKSTYTRTGQDEDSAEDVHVDAVPSINWRIGTFATYEKGSEESGHHEQLQEITSASTAELETCTETVIKTISELPPANSGVPINAPAPTSAPVKCKRSPVVVRRTGAAAASRVATPWPELVAGHGQGNMCMAGCPAAASGIDASVPVPSSVHVHLESVASIPDTSVQAAEQAAAANMMAMAKRGRGGSTSASSSDQGDDSSSCDDKRTRTDDENISYRNLSWQVQSWDETSNHDCKERARQGYVLKGLMLPLDLEDDTRLSRLLRKMQIPVIQTSDFALIQLVLCRNLGHGS